MRQSRNGTPVERNLVAAVACVPVSGQSLIVLSREIVYLLEYAMRSSQTEMGRRKSDKQSICSRAKRK